MQRKFNSNNVRLRRSALMLAIASVCLGISFNASANDADKVANNLKEWIKSGSYNYDTKAHTYKTDSRYVFTGGEYSIRTPTYRIQPLNIDLPDISHGTGCSGIDLYMGSFSFLTKEELKNFTKATTKAAPIYAFNLALQQFSPEIKNEIDKLRNLTHLISSQQLDSCMAAQYTVNSMAVGLAGMINPDYQVKGVGDRTIQHMTESLFGESKKNEASGEAVSEAVTTMADSVGTNIEDATKYVDEDVQAMARSKQGDVCAVAADNADAMLNEKHCVIQTLNQAMGYEKTGSFGNLMRLSSEIWVNALRKTKLYNKSPLMPKNMSDNEVREFVYSLFGTTYTLFGTANVDGKTSKCVATNKYSFQARPKGMTAKILLEGGEYTGLQSNNATNKKTSKKYCYLIDTDFSEVVKEWKSPSQEILAKLGNFKDDSFRTSSGAIDTSSQAYKDLENTILGKIYFSSTRDQDQPEFTEEELDLINIFPENLQVAIKSKVGANSPKLIYNTAEECIKPILAKHYLDLLRKVKDTLKTSISSYASSEENQENKTKTIAHLEKQYRDYEEEFNFILSEKNAHVCVNKMLEITNSTEDSSALF